MDGEGARREATFCLFVTKIFDDQGRLFGGVRVMRTEQQLFLCSFLTSLLDVRLDLTFGPMNEYRDVLRPLTQQTRLFISPTLSGIISDGRSRAATAEEEGSVRLLTVEARSERS